MGGKKKRKRRVRRGRGGRRGRGWRGGRNVVRCEDIAVIGMVEGSY